MPDCSRSSTASHSSSAASQACVLASMLAVFRASYSRPHPSISASRRICAGDLRVSCLSDRSCQHIMTSVAPSVLAMHTGRT